jgi:hypothetical protein
MVSPHPQGHFPKLFDPKEGFHYQERLVQECRLYLAHASVLKLTRVW